MDKVAQGQEGSRMEGALTEQFSDLKSLDWGAKIGDPNYTPRAVFLDHDIL